MARATTAMKSSMAVSGNSLFYTRASLLTVMCMFCGESKTEFRYDSYGNILFDDPDPADTGEQDYSTEGKDGFC